MTVGQLISILGAYPPQMKVFVEFQAQHIVDLRIIHLHLVDVKRPDGHGEYVRSSAGDMNVETGLLIS